MDVRAQLNSQMSSWNEQTLVLGATEATLFDRFFVLIQLLFFPSRPIIVLLSLVTGRSCAKTTAAK